MGLYILFRANATLQEVCCKWKAYLENLIQLVNCFGIDINKKILSRAIKYMTELSTLDSLVEIAQGLRNEVTEIALILTPSQIFSKISAGRNEIYLWIFNMLLQPQTQGISLSKIHLQELEEFIEL